MSNQDYYAEEALKTINHRIAYNEALMNALKKIERKHTKDGGDFKDLAKNFTTGAIRPNRYSPNEKELCYYAYTDEVGHISDSISLSFTVYNRSEEARRYAAVGRLQERGEFLHPFVTMTPDEIEQAIQDRIKYYQGIIDSYKKALDQFDTIVGRIHDIQQEYDQLLKDVPSVTEHIFKNVLFRQSER